MVEISVDCNVALFDSDIVREYNGYVDAIVGSVAQIYVETFVGLHVAVFVGIFDWDAGNIIFWIASDLVDLFDGIILR